MYISESLACFPGAVHTRAKAATRLSGTTAKSAQLGKTTAESQMDRNPEMRTGHRR